MNKHTFSDKPKTYGPYSPVRLAGVYAFVSGQVGIDPLSGYIDEDPVKQAAQALENVRGALSSIGMGLGDVVETTLFVTDMGDFPAINEVYGDYFTEPYPARACIAVKELPRVGGETPVKVEIKAVAMGQSV
jgi:2-iminobutanoate/2-iminopropanoate deaminase